MTSSMNDEGPWAGIVVDAGNWVGRRVRSAHPLAPFWAKHPSGAVGMVIQDVPDSSVPEEMPNVRGIALAVQDMSGELITLTMFLQIPEDRAVFARLCEDVVDYSGGATNAIEAGKRIFSRLRRWQSLLGKGRVEGMSEEEARGLYGEVWTIRERIFPMIGKRAGMAAWTALRDYPQDFAFAGGLLEIKTRLVGSRDRVWISSLEQLDSSSLLTLLVHDLVPSIDDPEIPSLNSMVSELIDTAAELSAESADMLRLVLNEKGWHPIPHYDHCKYVVTATRAFDVREGFPRIRRSLIDRRIDETTYSLELSQLGDFTLNAEEGIRRLCIGESASANNG